MVRVRVAALIVRDRRVLLARHVKHGRTSYLLPGGGIETRETAIEALTRELREEASAAVTIGALRYVVEAIAPDGSKHLLQLIFEATLANEVGPSTDPRVVACEWHDVAALRTLTIHPGVGQRLAADVESGDAAVDYVTAPWIV
ncbi:MAG TPA: NUDIX domain-containing protein [Candidatus Eremiobacteraceae bacterium]